MMFVQIAGFLGADPETRMSPTGQKITTFRIACNTRKQGKERTVWWRVTIFGDRFDKMLTYLKKGTFVFVFGTMNPPDIYQDREGNSQVSLEIIAEYLSFMPSQRSNTQQQQGEQQGSDTEHSSAAAPGYTQFAQSPNVSAPKTPFGGVVAGSGPQQEASDDDVPF